MKIVAIDFEAQDLTAKHDPAIPIWCIGFAWREAGELKSLCLPWDDGGKEKLEELNNDDDILFVFHNSSFDVAVARTSGVEIPSGKFHDTLLLSYLASPSAEGHGLASWGEVFGYPKLDCKDWMTGNTPALMEYCRRDTELCLLVYEHLMHAPYKDDIKLRNAYLNVELPYVEVIVQMERTGMFVDRSKLEELGSYLEFEIKKLQEELLELTGLVPESASLKWDTTKRYFTVAEKTFKGGYNKNKKNVRYYLYDDLVASSSPEYVYDHCKLDTFNPNSGHHLTWCLMKEGWVPQEYSKKSKEPATTADVIATLDYPIAKAYASISLLLKLHGTFVTGILSRLDGASVVRGSFNQCVTLTTRLSSSDPNLQNLPTRSELGKKIRECIVPPPGYVLLVADLDQIELRVLAYYLEEVMGESRMAQGIRDGVDPHTSNAESWGVPRTKAKTGIFGKLYGAQAKKMSKTLGCTEKEAQKLIDDIDKRMPAIQSLMERVWSTARTRNGDIYTLLGQRLRYPNLCATNKWERARAERQCFNALIQGTAAAINKELMVRALPTVLKYGGAVSFTVHDEYGVYIKEEYATQAINELNDIFRCNDILRGKRSTVPITGEWNAGTNWNTAKAG